MVHLSVVAAQRNAMNRNEEFSLATAALGDTAEKRGTQHGKQQVIYAIGTDEAGRGPLVGPVVAAAVCMPFVWTASADKKHTTTTALTAALSKLNDPSCNIMTIEDPVEIRLPFVRQVQVHPEIGLTFASALRSILRQDPDVVLVGEIRDGETATIALQAALTGHVVLSTLHTNDAVGAISRLRDFGLPSFVINSAVLGVLAQRLVRRVCAQCQVAAHVDELTRRRFHLEDGVAGFIKGRGCGRCSQSGYKGRVGLYELLSFTPQVKALVEQGGSVERIRELAVATGMRQMWQDGVEKARLGQTTLEEVANAASVVLVEDHLQQVKRAA